MPNSVPELRGFQRVWRTLKQLFFEVLAALFAVVALVWLNAALRSWTRDVAHWLIATAAAIAIIFVTFAITTFRKSRKI